MFNPSIYTYPNTAHTNRTTPNLKARVVTLQGDENRFMCDVATIDRRNYLETADIYLMNGKERIVSLKVAFGELRRKPQRFTAVVMHEDTQKPRTIEIRAGQLLVVWG